MEQEDYKRGSISVWESAWASKKVTFSMDKPRDDWGYFDFFKAWYLEKILLKNKNILSLECGCGAACISTYFASRGAKTVMLDASSSALCLAKQNFHNNNLGRGVFINGNMENLPLAEERFDLVMSFGVLEHFEDMIIPVREMVRVLKKGGIFFASVSPKKYSVQIIGNLVNMLMRFLYNIKHNRFKEAFLNSYPTEPEFFENAFSSQQYIQVMRECGLRDVKLSGSRPFPSLNLPREMFEIYIMIMKILRPLHIYFETHPSKFTELIGVEWDIIGTKG